MLTFEGKTLADAITNASVALGVASTDLKYEVVTEGSTGFLGMFAKPAVITVQPKADMTERAKEFFR